MKLQPKYCNFPSRLRILDLQHFQEVQIKTELWTLLLHSTVLAWTICQTELLFDKTELKFY